MLGGVRVPAVAPQRGRVWYQLAGQLGRVPLRTHRSLQGNDRPSRPHGYIPPVWACG